MQCHRIIPIGQAIGVSILAITVITLAWSYFGKIDIVATAPGRIVPIGKTKLIQPLETGVVHAILVADGDHVHAGDTLIELDPTQNGADRDRYRRDLLSARLDVARLEGLRRAIDSDHDPDLVDPPADAAPLDLEIARASMRAEIADEKAKLASLEQQIAGKGAEAEESDATAAKIRATLPVLQQEVDLRHELMGLQYGNKLAYLDAERQIIEQRQELPVLATHREGSLAAQAALTRQRDQAKAEATKSILDDLRKAKDQVSALEAEYTKAQEELTLTSLKAPIDGTVQQLSVHTIGGVVTPAQGLLVIVPDQDGLIAEVQVNNDDVGFVHEDQTAEIKVETFNFTRYGLIEGTVTSLSRDVVADSAKPQDKKKRGAGYQD